MKFGNTVVRTQSFENTITTFALTIQRNADLSVKYLISLYNYIKLKTCIVIQHKKVCFSFAQEWQKEIQGLCCNSIGGGMEHDLNFLYDIVANTVVFHWPSLPFTW